MTVLTSGSDIGLAISAHDRGELRCKPGPRERCAERAAPHRKQSSRCHEAAVSGLINVRPLSGIRRGPSRPSPAAISSSLLLFPGERGEKWEKGRSLCSAPLCYG